MTPGAQKLYSVAGMASPYEANPVELTVYVSCCNEENTIGATLGMWSRRWVWLEKAMKYW